MINEINHILAENHFLKNGKVIDKADVAKIKIDGKQEQKLVSKIDYIVENYGISALQPFSAIQLKVKTQPLLLIGSPLKAKRIFRKSIF